MDENCGTNTHAGSAFGIGLYVGDWYEEVGYKRFNNGEKIHDQVASGMSNCCKQPDQFFPVTLEVMPSPWVLAIETSTDDPELFYKSAVWSAPAPENKAIKEAYTTVKVAKLRLTMNGQMQVFEMQDEDAGRYTLQELFTG